MRVDEDAADDAVPGAIDRINAWIPELEKPTGTEPLTWDDLIRHSVARAETS